MLDWGGKGTDFLPLIECLLRTPSMYWWKPANANFTELIDLVFCSVIFVQVSQFCFSAIGFGKGVQLGELKLNSFPNLSAYFYPSVVCCVSEFVTSA